jgi:pilus assembly protein CpaE
MIAEVSANHRTAKLFLQMARRLTGHVNAGKANRSLLSPIIKMLSRRAAR